MENSLLIRLEIVKELSKRELSISELEKILLRFVDYGEDVEKIKLIIADLINIKNSRVYLSREGKLLLSLIR